MHTNLKLRLWGTAAISVAVAAISGAAPAQTQNIPARIRAQIDKIEIQANGTAIETIHNETQILTAAAITQLAQLPIGYIESMQDVDIVEAYTQKADGRKIAVDKGAIITRQPPGASQLPMFSDAKQRVIVFPNVEPGDTVVYTAHRRDKSAMFPGHYLRAGLRVMAEAVRWGKRGTRVNTISPGIIVTPLAKDELTGPRGAGYRRMIELSAAGRAGTRDEVGTVGALLMGTDGGFITGSDFLKDGGVTAAYWYGELAPK